MKLGLKGLYGAVVLVLVTGCGSKESDKKDGDDDSTETGGNVAMNGVSMSKMLDYKIELPGDNTPSNLKLSDDRKKVQQACEMKNTINSFKSSASMAKSFACIADYDKRIKSGKKIRYNFPDDGSGMGAMSMGIHYVENEKTVVCFGSSGTLSRFIKIGSSVDGDKISETVHVNLADLMAVGGGEESDAGALTTGGIAFETSLTRLTSNPEEVTGLKIRSTFSTGSDEMNTLVSYDKTGDIGDIKIGYDAFGAAYKAAMLYDGTMGSVIYNDSISGELTNYFDQDMLQIAEADLTNADLKVTSDSLPTDAEIAAAMTGFTESDWDCASPDETIDWTEADIKAIEDSAEVSAECSEVVGDDAEEADAMYEEVDCSDVEYSSDVIETVE